MQEAVGVRIRRARAWYGMSQAELARRIGVTVQGMNQIEQGKIRDPRSSRVKAIAQTIHVSADYLLGLSEERGEGHHWPAAVGGDGQKPTAAVQPGEDRVSLG